MTDAVPQNELAEGSAGAGVVDPALDAGVSERSVRRRTFMKGVMLTAGAAATSGAGIRYGSQESEAIAPVVAGAAAVAGASVFTWALTEFAVSQGDDPPEGLTPDALRNEIRTSHRARVSTNNSTFLDNRNILAGIENSMYTEAKISAIEKLNEGETQEAVQDAATDTVESYGSTVLNNFLSSWNESVYELENHVTALREHPDLSVSGETSSDYLQTEGSGAAPLTGGVFHEGTMQLPDGTDFAVRYYDMEANGYDGDHTIRIKPHEPVEIVYYQYDGQGDSLSHYAFFGWNWDDEDYHPDVYLDGPVWESLYTDIIQAIDDVKSNVSLWVDTLYGQVQSGEIDISDIISPSMRAEMISEDETLNQAIADLIALNQYVDPDREAMITLQETDVTLVGTFARTDSTGSLDAGTTYDPETDLDGDVYFTYDVAAGSGVWNDYETAVDGGIVTFTSEPHEEVEYDITTIADETATVVYSDFIYDDAGEVWTVDLTEELDDTITEVDTVEFFHHSEDEASYETIQLAQPFHIDGFEDSDGESVESASFDQSTEPQTDDNYITQEEWDEMQRRNEELIQKYEDSQSSGGGGFGLGALSIGEVPGVGVLAIGAGIVALLYGNAT